MTFSGKEFQVPPQFKTSMLFFGFCRQNRFAFGSDVLSWELSIFYHPFSLSFLSDLSDNLSWMELFNQEFT